MLSEHLMLGFKNFITPFSTEVTIYHFGTTVTPLTLQNHISSNITRTS